MRNHIPKSRAAPDSIYSFFKGEGILSPKLYFLGGFFPSLEYISLSDRTTDSTICVVTFN